MYPFMYQGRKRNRWLGKEYCNMNDLTSLGFTWTAQSQVLVLKTLPLRMETIFHLPRSQPSDESVFDQPQVNIPVLEDSLLELEELTSIQIVQELL